MLTSRPISRNGEGNMHRQVMKTPGRPLQGRGENAIRYPPGTVNGKGKNVLLQTPFQAKSSKGDTQLKGGVRAPSRPLLDKTPFPNRIITTEHQTPFVQGLSVDTPDSLLRPSSARKHIRVPRNSQKFETPLNTKNHWDISDDNIEVALSEPPKMVEPEDDYDEVEYMAPNTLDLPYQPPLDFEPPDFKELGKALVEASRSGKFLEDGPPPPELEVDMKDLEPCSWDLLSLPPLEDDDPFREAKKSKPVPSSSRVLPQNKAKAVPVPPVRVQSVASGSRAVAARISRPGTSASTTVPSRTSTVPSRTGMVPSSSTNPSRTTVKAPGTRSTTTIVRSKSNIASTRPAAAAITAASRTKPSQSSSKAGFGAGAAAVKRPATSASTYRPAVSIVARSAGPIKPSTSTTRVAAASASAKPGVPAGTVRGQKRVEAGEEDELVKALNVVAPVEDEDFLFDV